MNTRKIPLTVMLLGASVTCVATYLNNYTLSEMLAALLISLIVFLIIGVIVGSVLNRFAPPQDPDGEVIEKDSTEENPDEGDEGLVHQVGDTGGQN